MLKQMFNQMVEVGKYGMMHVRNEKGQGMVEYALIIALVAIVAIAALILLGPSIANIFSDISGEIGGEELGD